MVGVGLTASPVRVRHRPHRHHGGALTATLTDLDTGRPIAGQPITFTTGGGPRAVGRRREACGSCRVPGSRTSLRGKGRGSHRGLQAG